MVDAAETRKAAFTIFPRSSIFSIIVIAGTGLTMPIRRPAALLSFSAMSSLLLYGRLKRAVPQMTHAAG
jgi:hypothetical protein